MSLIELRSRYAVKLDENPRPEVAVPKQDVAPGFGSTDKRTQHRFVVEGAVPADVTATGPIYRLPEVDGPAWVGGLVGLLAHQ